MRLTVIGCAGSYPNATSPASCYLVEHDGHVVVAPPTLPFRSFGRHPMGLASVQVPGGAITLAARSLNASGEYVSKSLW